MKKTDKDAAFFRKIFLFQDLEDREIEQVLDRTSPREFPAGSEIIREGEPGDSMYIMVSGEVEITKQLTLVLDKDTPKERVMIRLKADDGVYFGEMSLLEQDTRSATVTALTDCQPAGAQSEGFPGADPTQYRHGGETPVAPGPAPVPASAQDQPGRGEAHHRPGHLPGGIKAVFSFCFEFRVVKRRRNWR